MKTVTGVEDTSVWRLEQGLQIVGFENCKRGC